LEKQKKYVKDAEEKRTLTHKEFMIVCLVSSRVFFAMEIEKAIFRKRRIQLAALFCP
jgi:hypothetical protein